VRRLALLIACGAAWLVLAAAPALADGGPHVMTVNNGSLGLNADGCAGCHRAHTAQGPFLINAADETALCITCHGVVATGATTDVMSGIQYSLRGVAGVAGTQLGALRGGGFDQARLDPSNAARRAYTLSGGVEFLAKVPVGPALDVTSAHLDVDGGDGVVASGVAWGNGDNSTGAGAGPIVDMSCSSCHNPHGNGQYRILNPIPNPTALTGLFAAIGAPGALVTDTPVINPATGTPDTKNYTILQVKGTPGVTSSYLLYASQVATAAGAGTFNGIAGTYTAAGGDYFHRFVPWNATTIPTRAADAPNGVPATFTNQMNAWCTACHTRYNANDPFTARLDLLGAEDPIFRYQHQTTPLSDGASCLTCHVSHGSNAVMSGPFSATMPFPDGNPKFIPTTTTVVPDSRLLKFNNRGTCQACHDPTFTVLTGQTTGPALGTP
jgi:predicted CXXCH cytochrome family protein